jgi:hypothetical protein
VDDCGDLLILKLYLVMRNPQESKDTKDTIGTLNIDLLHSRNVGWPNKHPRTIVGVFGKKKNKPEKKERCLSSRKRRKTGPSPLFLRNALLHIPSKN